jgi:hypothetical protein
MNGSIGDTKQNGGLAAAATKDAPSEPPSAPNVQDPTTRLLRFLATASPETIGGIVVGLLACTYLILGRLGLVLIGAVGGIVLHATWESHASPPGSPEDLRREKGLDIVKRLLDLRENATQDSEGSVELAESGNGFEGFLPETAASLNNLVDAVIRDYVKWWYNPIVPEEESFPAAARKTLTNLIVAISNNLARKRPADTFLDFTTNSSSILIVFLSELSTALSSSPATTLPAEAVYTYLSANPESNLANVLSRKQQAKKFKMIAEDILVNFLEKPAYGCDPARTFLREILANVVLEMTLKSCSKPEWINGWIVYLLEEGEPDISQAIDEAMNNTNGSGDYSLEAIEGNIGSMSVSKPSRPRKPNSEDKREDKRHKKRLSKAEEAMEEAMEEAKRLSRLIAEDEANKGPIPESPLKEASGSPTPAVASSLSSPIGLNTPDWGSNVSSTENVTAKPNTQPTISQPQSPRAPVATSTAVPSVSASVPFTSFDQIIPPSIPAALQEQTSPRRKTTSLTLHNANILIYDDSTPIDKGRMRTKPTADYLLQIEPKSTDHPGWMIVRRYSDFETLHEVLRRIAQVSGVIAFAEQHKSLPNWKDHTKASLRGELERYLRDACWYQQLAESEGMKRFLEKDQSNSSGSSQKTGFGWPTPSAFETMGKGMLDVLTSAPKGVADGGKAIGGGITGVFNNIGNLGQKKPPANVPQNFGAIPAGRNSTSALSRIDSVTSLSGSRLARASEDSLRATPVIQTQPGMIMPMERRPSFNPDESEREARSSSARSSISGRRSANISRDPSSAPPSRRGTPLSSPLQANIDRFQLPPPPSDMPDDFFYPEDSMSNSRSETAPRTSTSTAPSQHSPGRQSLSIPRLPSEQALHAPRPVRKEHKPFTEQETRVAVELIFAVVNEIYTLSSAWNIRRTLLTAAKTFLLRPGNPSLTSIQSLIQDSIIASNTSDAGIAGHLRKIRENTLPTEEELKAWPPEMSAEEKERLRVKARSLLVANAIPEALKGVMGQAASEVAMGRIFDLVQEEEIARGLIFGLLLQGVRAITH